MSGRVQVNKTLLENAQVLLDGLKSRGWDGYTQTLAQNLQSELDEKYEADKRRRLFTAYKTADNKNERETARHLYLDSVGMHRDWRSDKECSITEE